MKYIFLHSTWRAASTYHWAKFRYMEGVLAFYEPFHPALFHMKREDTVSPTDTSELGHTLEDTYWKEYYLAIPAGRKGVPFFKRSFARSYIPNRSNYKLPNPQKNYIKYLIDVARENHKIPCLGFVRSCCRAGAIKEAFGGIHIGLVRNPYFQYLSYEKRSGFLDGAKRMNQSIKTNFPHFCNKLKYKCFLGVEDSNLTFREFSNLWEFGLYYYISNLSLYKSCDFVLDVDDVNFNKEITKKYIEYINDTVGLSINLEDFRRDLLMSKIDGNKIYLLQNLKKIFKEIETEMLQLKSNSKLYKFFYANNEGKKLKFAIDALSRKIKRSAASII